MQLKVATAVWSASLALVLILGATACGKDDTPPPRVVASAAPAALTVEGSREDLILRYLDPETGQVATALSLDDIPTGARGRVVVYDAISPPPPGWDHLADLRQGWPATTTPTRDFSFTVTASAGSSKAGGNKTATTVMFSTQGCGYCKKARKFFASKRVPFTEYDVERDPKAGAKLAEMGRKAGIPESQLQGVPIIFIDGKVMVGFDQRRIASMLGM